MRYIGKGLFFLQKKEQAVVGQSPTILHQTTAIGVASTLQGCFGQYITVLNKFYAPLRGCNIDINICIQLDEMRIYK